MNIYFYSTKNCFEFIGFLVFCNGGAATIPHHLTKKRQARHLLVNPNFRQLT